MRPHITGRVLRAHSTLLGASLTGAAALTVVSVAGAVGAVVPSPPSSRPLPEVSGTPGGVPIAQLVGPALSAPAPARVGVRIGRTHLDVLDGSAATVVGALHPGLAGRTVELQRLGGHGWRGLSHTLTRRHGRFVLHYVPRRLLSERVRVLFAGDSGDLRARRNVGRLSSYRLAGASWYGGGGSLACGGQLSGSTMGVANKTLPCGTLVTLRYGGRSVRVPVVDRGPYVAGRDFDLTEATKRALGFEGTGDVWSTR